jgi:hypothetical protein
MRARPWLATVSLALTASCASTAVEVEWERVESPRFVSKDGGFALELPVGWLRSGQVLARDPNGAHAISFNAGPVLAGESTLAVEAGAPQLLQAMEDQLALQPGVEVRECRAVVLDGLPAFRAHYLEHADGAPASEHLLYGAVAGEMLYAFALEAPAGAEFTRDLPEFEALVASFRRLAPANP